jgi:heme-degrading monooxygenase HmoA
LVIQKIHRLGVGVANNRQARAKAKDHTLYASHTVWNNRAAFEAWTKSEAFRAAHASAGGNKPLYLGHPQFEGFETIQTVKGR